MKNREDKEGEEEDDDDDDDGATDVFGSEYAADGLAFRRQMVGDGTTTGLRSAVRGVVPLTATPAACGHDVGDGASQVLHQVYKMEHPANYVGYEWTAAPYAQVTIQHAPVPDRKQLNQIAKTVFYNEILKANDWLDANDEPMMPFKRRADGVITVTKKDLSDIPWSGKGKSTLLLALAARRVGGAGISGSASPSSSMSYTWGDFPLHFWMRT